MFVRRWISLLSVLALFLLPAEVCRAEGSAALCQAYARDKNVDMYIAGEINPESLACKGSNQALEIAGSGFLADSGVTVRTTLLLDVSASMPKDMRDSVKVYIDKLIENIPGNEQYKIVTFDEELAVLQDFTNDRYDLANAAGGISFDGQESKIYDAIYNTMPETGTLDGGPCYYRTVVITDGIDDTASGITKEELYLKLQTETYPVEVVAVSVAEQAEEEKELAALTRISGGRYVNLYAEAEPEAVASALGTEGIYWVRAGLPDSLLDGSLRPFVLTDGNVTLQFDVRVPAADLPAEEGIGSSDAEVSGSSSEAAEDTESSGESSLGEGSEDAEGSGQEPSAKVPEDSGRESSGESSEADRAESGWTAEKLLEEYSFIVIAAGAGIVVIIAAVITLAAVQGRKKKERPAAAGKKGAGDTEILGAGSSGTEENGTLCIRIRDINHPEQSWDVSLAGTVLVGREAACHICITENSMSRQQFILYLVSNIPTIENKSKSNITKLNGELLNVPRPVKEGDKIKCGRVTLIVDSLYHGTGSDGGKLNKDTRFVNV